ncbi:hypothetical protein BSU04_26325 [Caballeronia sordidicola]|uniref:Uncharacterized protein n=1 Tax=Caballeronia sordidicola TaxID=196367 RepID=A0A226WWI7_CABSO|nr:hypothetical protein [Caballeronia sordidicola]OXC75551.1 hypothetical protein BSU04_26325 [Caballeronia sordidicola]
MFRTIEEQRRLITSAQSLTRKAKRRASSEDDRSAHATFWQQSRFDPSSGSTQQPDAVDYSKPAAAYDVEQW